MPNIYLDGWVCDSGDIWARRGNLRCCMAWQAERGMDFTPTCPNKVGHCTDQPAQPQMFTHNLHFIIREMKSLACRRTPGQAPGESPAEWPLREGQRRL